MKHTREIRGTSIPVLFSLQ